MAISGFKTTFMHLTSFDFRVYCLTSKAYQSAVTLCGWGVKAGMAHSIASKVAKNHASCFGRFKGTNRQTLWPFCSTL